jgi:dual-specificity kinase
MKKLDVCGFFFLLGVFYFQEYVLTTLQDIIPTNNKFLSLFLDLLKKIFVYEPSKRITAHQALQHPWFKEVAQPDDGTEATRIRVEREKDRIKQEEMARLPPMHAP